MSSCQWSVELVSDRAGGRARRRLGIAVNAARVDQLESRRLLATYYVDQALGADTLSGLQLTPSGSAGPFKTISKAAAVATAGDNILIRSGTYRETITPARSGTTASPITYRPYNNEVVTISGADVLGGWTLNSGSTYKAPMAWTMGGEDDQVFVDSQMMIYARWPNTTVDISRPTTETAGAGSTGTLSGSVLTSIIVDPSLTQANGYWTGATIHIAPGPVWLYETRSISSSVVGTLTYTSSFTSGTYGAAADNPYFITGKFSLLDTAGEYYRDSTTGQMYLWTPQGDSPALHVVEAKRRQWAFDLSGRSNINIQGLNFFAAGLLSSSTSSRLTIDGIKATYVAHFGTWSGNWSAKGTDNGIILNGSSNSLVNSEIAFSAGNGVVLLGSNHVVSNNVIHDVNYTANDTSAINIAYGAGSSGMDIGYNTLYNSGRGLLVHGGLSASRIHNNRMFNPMLQVTDGGATYTSQHNGNGTEIDHNVVSDSVNYTRGGYNGVGIYIDDKSSGFTAHHNVVWNAETGMMSKGNNNVFNNTLASSPMQNPNTVVSLAVKGEDGVTVVKNNIFTARTVFSGTTTVTGSNIVVGTDPQFVSPTAANVQLQATSPARDSGEVLSPYTNGYIDQPDLGAYEYGSNVWSAGSSIAAAAAIPATPSLLTLTPISFSQVNVAWQDNATNETAYVIERCDDGQIFRKIATLPPGTTSYIDSTPTGGYANRYTYRVRADNGYINSASTPWATIFPGRDAFIRQEAEGFDGQSGLGVGNSTIYSFDSGDYAGFDLMDFGSTGAARIAINLATSATYSPQIEVRVDSITGTLLGTLTVTSTGDYNTYAEESCTVTPLSGVHSVFLISKSTAIANVDYFYFVRAPIAPSALAATPASTSSITVAWTDNSADETGFEIDRATNSLFTQNLSFVTTTAANRTTYTDTGLTAGTTYYYRVRSTNAAGDSLNSPTASAITTPTAPALVSLLATSDTGVSSADRITSRNNATPAKSLQFSLSGLFAGATVQLFDGTTLIGTTVVGTGSTVSLTTNGNTTLADGVRTITARQVLGSTSAASGSLAVIIDTVAPTLTLLGAPTGITPSSVASLGLSFSEAAYGLTASAAVLTRDGGANVLTAAQTPTTSNQSLWTIPSLSIVTANPGSYAFALSPAGITDVAGNTLASGTSAAWTKNTLTGTASADNLTVAFTSATTASITTNGAPAYAVNLAPLGSLTIDGSGGADALALVGVAPDVPLRLAGTIALATVPSTATLTVTGSGSLVTASSFKLAALSVESGATARATGGTGTASVLSSLTVAATGALDLTTSDLILRSYAANLSDVRSLITGNRLKTTTTTPLYTTLSAFPNDAGDGSTPYFSAYDGVTNLAVGDVIVKFTYQGDTDLDGQLTGKDFARILEGFSTGQTGWAYGDVDNSGGAVSLADWSAFYTAYTYYQSHTQPNLGNGAGDGNGIGGALGGAGAGGGTSGGGGAGSLGGGTSGGGTSGGISGGTGGGSGDGGGSGSPLARTPAPALSKLVYISAALTNVTTGHSLGRLQVELRDASGNLAKTDTSKVSVKLGSSTSAKLFGIATVRARNGRAIFSNLSIRQAGNYTLEFYDPGYISAVTDSFTISTGFATKVVFSSVPTSVSANAPFTVGITLQDRYGNSVVTSTSNATLDFTGPSRVGQSSPFASGTALLSSVILTERGRYLLTASVPNVASAAQVLRVT
jgi:hypothetical protein